MPFIVKSVITVVFFVFLVGNEYKRLWKGALIGLGLVLATDLIAYGYDLYHYNDGLFMIGGIIPLLHILNMFLITMIYLNWLPGSWRKRFLYTLYVSVMALAIEGSMYRAGALVYQHWKIGYSFVLINGCLLLLAYLSDFASGIKSKTQDF